MTVIDFINYCSDAFNQMSLDQKLPFIFALFVSIWIFSFFNNFIIWIIKKVFKINNRSE